MIIKRSFSKIIKRSFSSILIALLCTVMFLMSGCGAIDDMTPDFSSDTSYSVSKVDSSSAGQAISGSTDTSDTAQASSASSESTAAASSGEAVSDYVQYTFRSQKLLEQHYEKHGIDMGYDSAESYQQAASDVINDPSALHKTEAEDGDTCYYIEASNEFVVLSTDGYIRTYFLPDSGKSYYDRQ